MSYSSTGGKQEFKKIRLQAQLNIGIETDNLCQKWQEVSATLNLRAGSIASENFKLKQQSDAVT